MLDTPCSQSGGGMSLLQCSHSTLHDDCLSWESNPQVQISSQIMSQRDIHWAIDAVRILIQTSLLPICNCASYN